MAGNPGDDDDEPDGSDNDPERADSVSGEDEPGDSGPPPDEPETDADPTGQPGSPEAERADRTDGDEDATPEGPDHPLDHVVEGRDPVEVAGGGEYDLYDVATWEPRTWLDGFSVRLHRWMATSGRGLLISVALAIVVAEFALVGVTVYDEPIVGAYVLLSIVPALAIAAYVWRADVTRREPLGLLVVTFLFGFLFAGFAAIVNTMAQGYFQYVPFVGLVLFFFLVVAPVEEFVKWLAVRLYAYRSSDFDSVLDGAVYGAIAGLGFATIENSIYIVGRYLQTLQMGSPEEGVGAVVGVAALRSFAGPGHVLYASLSGYYLGLAKFNRENRGPIVVKGLVIAAGLHAFYNTVVTYMEPILAVVGGPVGSGVAFLGFVVVYDGAIAYVLYRKIKRYRTAYDETGAEAYDRHPENEERAGTPDGDEGETSVS